MNAFLIRCRRSYASFAALAAMSAIVAGCGGEKPVANDSSPVWCLAFSPDGKLLAGGRGRHPRFNTSPWRSGDGQVDVWRSEGWGLARSYTADLTSYVAGVCFSRDGSVLYAACDKYGRPLGRGNPLTNTPNIITSWSVTTGESSTAIAIEWDGAFGSAGQMTGVSPDGLIALGRGGNHSLVIDLNAAKRKYSLGGGGELVIFSPDWKVLASCTYSGPDDRQGRIRLFDAATGKSLAAPDWPQEGAFSFAYSPDGTRMAVGCANGAVIFSTPDLARVLGTVTLEPVDKDTRVRRIAYAPDGQTVAAATDTVLYLIDVPSMKVKRATPKHPTWIWAVAISPDSKVVAVGYGDEEGDKSPRTYGGVKVWDVATGELVKDLK